MGQIQQTGKEMMEIIEKYEVPVEFHAALWAAYEAGAEMGFWKAITTAKPVSVLEHKKQELKEMK